MQSVLKVSIRQVKAARALLAWSQADLARQSGISEPTIKRLESQDCDLGGRADTGEKIVAALETAGVIFVESSGEGPGARLKKGYRMPHVDVTVEESHASSFRPRRQKLQMTVEQLAEAAKVSVAALSELENTKPDASARDTSAAFRVEEALKCAEKDNP